MSYHIYKFPEKANKKYFVDGDNKKISFSTIPEALVFISGRPTFKKMSHAEAKNILKNNFNVHLEYEK